MTSYFFGFVKKNTWPQPLESFSKLGPSTGNSLLTKNSSLFLCIVSSFHFKKRLWMKSMKVSLGVGIDQDECRRAQAQLHLELSLIWIKVVDWFLISSSWRLGSSASPKSCSTKDSRSWLANEARRNREWLHRCFVSKVTCLELTRRAVVLFPPPRI